MVSGGWWGGSAQARARDLFRVSNDVHVFHLSRNRRVRLYSAKSAFLLSFYPPRLIRLVHMATHTKPPNATRINRSHRMAALQRICLVTARPRLMAPPLPQSKQKVSSSRQRIEAPLP